MSLDLLNDLVNEKERLLERFRTFTNQIYEKEVRIRHDTLVWVVNKKLNAEEIKEKEGINREITDLNDLINMIPAKLDNELYNIIMKKNRVITESINILNSTTPYNKVDEEKLNKNDGFITNFFNVQINQFKARSPPKVQEKAMKARSSSKYSHSYGSKSSHSMRLKDFEIDTNNSELLLINAIGDGDCFINAIFDYGLYTGTLVDIYNRLIHLELLIMSVAKYKDGVKKAKSLFNNPTLTILTENEYTKILDNKLLKESASDIARFHLRYRVPPEQLLMCYHHPYPDDREKNSKEYEEERSKFIKFMKYIQVLYVYTYGYKVLSKRLDNIFSVAINTKVLDSFDFDTGFIIHIKETYYKQNGNLKPMNISNFLDDYMRYYAKTEGYYTGGDQILIFRKIFFKKLREKSSRPIPRFWLNFEFSQTTNISTKRVKFMKILQDSLVEDKDKNFISIIRDGEHFKLFVYREQIVVDL